jgi:hypothetical protein
MTFREYGSKSAIESKGEKNADDGQNRVHVVGTRLLAGCNEIGQGKFEQQRTKMKYLDQI